MIPTINQLFLSFLKFSKKGTYSLILQRILSNGYFPEFFYMHGIFNEIWGKMFILTNLIYEHIKYRYTLFIIYISFQRSIEATKMEKEELPYSVEEEAKGQHINVGNKEIEFNAHIPNIESIDLD